MHGHYTKLVNTSGALGTNLSTQTGPRSSTFRIF